MLQHHIALICSSEQSLDFYRSLGFEEFKRVNRGYDIIVWMKAGITTLEIFLDPTHPAHVDHPEAYGLRHIAFETEYIEQMHEIMMPWKPEEIKTVDGIKVFFVKDPDGCPFEIREYIPHPPID